MLKGLHPLLGPELLHALAAMGHGDEIGVVDANFPAAGLGRRVIRLDGVSAPAVLEAVLTVLPLDHFVDHPLTTMAVVGAPLAEPEVVAEFGVIASRAEGRAVARQALAREPFYEHARQAFALVQCGERRLYGNVLLRKGVVAP
jgi:L-fucose mutarotase